MDRHAIADRRTIARFDTPRTDRSTRIAVVSDVHLTLDSPETSSSSGREAVLRRTVRDIRRLAPDGVVFLGDLTDGSAAAATAFDRAAGRLEGSVVGVPGNHDPSPISPRLEPYAEAGPSPVVERIGGVTVVGIDSRGGVTDRQLRRLDRALASASSPSIVALHHALPGPVANLRGAADGAPAETRITDPVTNHGGLLAICRRRNVAVALCGHVHTLDAVRSGGIRQVVAPPLCTPPGGYLLLDVTPSGTAVTFVPVDGLPTLETPPNADPVERWLCRLSASRLRDAPIVTESTARVKGSRP
ncbi:metallophosphoesterase family protein [Natrarchaeobius chitinivorans]|nr:metallophosphoesterase [Natrarchaeobius chitinivorans]